MNLVRCNYSPSLLANPITNPKKLQIISAQKRCLRCNTLYEDGENSSTACTFHGYATAILGNYGDVISFSLIRGEKGLFAFAPPHQGIDGEWTDRSGVIVYRWNDTDNRPNTGRANWKKRWSCCGEYDENSKPCRRGWHSSYDDGSTCTN